MSIPRSTGHLPSRFNYFHHPTPIGPDEHLPSYDPLFPFGHGLSYTDFDYGPLTVSDRAIGPHETTTVSVQVRNVGDRSGSTVVQVYVSDHPGSRVTPVRELRGFERVSLDPGETETVSIEVDAASLGPVTADGTRTAEPGSYTISVGEQETTVTVETTYD